MNKQTKARVFEVTGSGGFLLTEKSDNLLNFFNLSQISIFNDKEELFTNIKKILNNIKMRDKMVKSSFYKSKNLYLLFNYKQNYKANKSKKIKTNNKFLNFKNQKDLSYIETFFKNI